MAVFSERNGYKTPKNFMEETPTKMKNRIIGIFISEEHKSSNPFSVDYDLCGVEKMMIELGIDYDFPDNRITEDKNVKKLKEYLLVKGEWYIIYDFIEKYLNILDSEKSKRITKEFNRILEEELCPYRIIKKQVVPITSEQELESLDKSTNTKYENVNIHMKKALGLYADRKNPDYENSIKESISAVEALCCTITGENGKNSTLGKTIKKLKEKGIYIHGSMEAAYSNLYGYASDEDGIRHGGIDFKDAPSEDAKYMLISCSAFINYLIEKWSKVQ